MEPGTPATGKMITALRLLGFDAVFDTDYAADLTIVEEAHELLTRLDDGGPLPMITSCSPGWVSFMEKFYPALIPHASTCKSPMSMLSTLAKTYYAEKRGIDPAKIYVVAVMPCVAKKHEARRGEHALPCGTPYTDAVLTTRELIWMIKCYGIHFASLEDGEFDAPLGTASGAGDIFGTTGGVMEATLRAASELMTGKPADRLEFTEVRAVEGLRETYVAIGDKSIHLAVANGLQNAKTLLDKVIADSEKYQVIEVMACPGGCIGGGGQPYPPEGLTVLDPELLRKRAERSTASTARKSSAIRTRTPLSRNSTMTSSARRLRKGPRTAAHPLPGTIAARYSMNTSTDNWEQVQDTARQILGEETIQFIELCRERAESGEPIDCRAPQGAGRVRLPGGGPPGRGRPADANPGGQGGRGGKFLSLLPPGTRGRFMINVCLGTACYVKGADRVAQKLMDELGIRFGETSTDGVFTLEGSRCIGTCGLAPVMMVDNDVHAEVTPDQVPVILDKYLDKVRRENVEK